jgi:hypothetical protein
MASGAARRIEREPRGGEKLNDARIAASAFERCGAHFVLATEAAQARKKA